jgi:hypothetical protein
MSGTKRPTRVVYVDDYEHQQRHIRDLETQNRDLAQKARDNSVRNLVEASEQRISLDLDQLRGQVTREARQAQVERLEIQQRMQHTLNEVAGVKQEVKNTQHMISDLRQQMQQYEQEATRQRSQIRQDVNVVKQEVKKNQAMIEQNRQKIDRNYNEMKRQFQGLLKTLDDMERKRELEKAVNASEIIDQVFARMESISKRFAELYDPNRYNEAIGNYNKAVDLFEKKQFDTSKRIAESAYRQFSDLNAGVERFRQEYEAAYAAAANELSRARGSVDFLSSETQVELETAGKVEKVTMKDLTAAWFGEEPAILEQQLKELEKAFDGARETTQLNYISQKASLITTQAQTIQDGVFAKHRQDEERAMLSQAIIRALSKDMEKVEPPYLERPDDLNSPLIIIHEKEPKVFLPLSGSFEMKFEKVDERKNMEMAREFTNHLKTEGVEVSELVRAD